ncbi:hypothetical protein CRA11_001240 [Escherichia coli]|nr:hypothetical protein [Escherichia coli]EFH6298542.1 hypothetical protein [Escherichia coli]
MTTTIDKNQWCGQFKRCNGCKPQQPERGFDAYKLRRIYE